MKITLINENIFPLKVSSLRQAGWYLCQNPNFAYLQYTCFNWPYSICLHVKWEWGICLNRTNYPIINMQDFRYWLCTSMYDLFWSAGIATLYNAMTVMVYGNIFWKITSTLHTHVVLLNICKAEQDSILNMFMTNLVMKHSPSFFLWYQHIH